MKNKTSKYFKYAIGEIILVVIGILIALQINNWNEKRKTKEIIKGVYNIVTSDLQSDVKTIDRVLNGEIKWDSLFKRVINKEITYDDYVKCTSCASLLTGYPDIKLKTRGLKLLEENSVFLSSSQDSLSLKIMDFYDYFNTEIEVALGELSEDFTANFYFFKKMPWYEDFNNRKFNEEFTKYALTSFDYRNRIISFYDLYYKGYLGHLRQYKQEALVLIETINSK